MELERICFHCCYFFMEVKVENLGVCMEDEAFLPFADEIYDSGNFDCCYELYMEKRFDGSQEACEQYVEAEIEFFDVDEDEDELISGLKHRPMDDVLAKLSGSDRDSINKAVQSLYKYICFDGRLEAMTPGPNALHQFVVLEIEHLMRQNCSLDFVVLSAPIDLILAEVRQPDLVMNTPGHVIYYHKTGH